MAYASTTFPRLKNAIRIIRFIHLNPYCSIIEIAKECEISPATFYRFLHAFRDLDVDVVFAKYKDQEGYKIKNYGLINKIKL